MKILLLSPDLSKKRNGGHHLFKKEMCRQHDVINYGKGYPKFNPKYSVIDIIKKVCKEKPDIIFTYCWKWFPEIIGMEEINDIPKIHFALDYTEQHHHFNSQNASFKKDKYDLIFSPSVVCCDLLKSNKVSENIKHLPFSVDLNFFKKQQIRKQDIILSAFTPREDFYPNRLKLIQAIHQAGFEHTGQVPFQTYVKYINKCKVAVTSNDTFGTFSMKYTEILACGGFLLADYPVELELLGYEDKKHLVIYKNFKDFKSKLKYYMNDKNCIERERIEKAGMEFVRENHSCKVRVKQMTKTIRDIFNIK